MRHCRLERKAKRPISNDALAKQLQVTPNYVSALENGRAMPSLETFLRYLLVVGFDTQVLLKLSFPGTSTETELSRLRSKIYELIQTSDEHQLRFLLEQIRIAQAFKIKVSSLAD